MNHAEFRSELGEMSDNRELRVDHAQITDACVYTGKGGLLKH